MQERSRHLAPDDKAGPRFPENRPGQPCSQQADQYSKEHFAAEERLVALSPHNNAFSVSSVVNTKEYHDAFERMPLAKPVREGAYRQAGRILQAADGTDYEYMAAIDTRDGRLVVDNLAREPSRKKTGFTLVELGLIKRNQNQVVILHNHPSSTPPSYADLLTAAQNHLIYASIVAGHDGCIWYMAIDTPFAYNKLTELRNQFAYPYGSYSETKALKELLSYNEAHHLFQYWRLR